MGKIKTFINSLNPFKRAAGGASASPAVSSPGAAVFSLRPQGTAMNVATVFGCVDVLAGAVSNLPVLYEKRKGRIYVEDDDSSMSRLLNLRPCAHMCAPDFWRLVVQDLLLDGNAYIVPTYDKFTGELWRLARADPKCVAHDTLNDTYDVYDIQGCVGGKFGEDEIIHLKNYTTDGKTGISTLAYARISTSTALAGDSETLERFENGGNVRGIVTNEGEGLQGFGKVQDEELDRAAVSIDEKFRRGERIVSVPGDAHFSQMTLSSQDMQFLESRKFNGLDICRFFRVPPQLVFHDTATNYKSAEMANVAFLSNTLNPLLRKIETELQTKLIPAGEARKYRIRFDREGLLAADLLSMAKYQTSMIATGMYTVNELRMKANKPSVPGGDRILVSANLKDINDMSLNGTKDGIKDSATDEEDEEGDEDDEKE